MKKYVVKIDSPGAIIRTSNGDNTTNISMVKKVEKFWVAAATTTALTRDEYARFAQILNALSNVLPALSQTLK